MLAGLEQAHDMVDLLLGRRLGGQGNRLQDLQAEILRCFVVESAADGRVHDVQRLVSLSGLQQAVGVGQPELSFVRIDRKCLV